jgi:hypothetical protein
MPAVYRPHMSKLLFEVEQDGDWFVAVCHEPEMATQAKTREELPAMIRDLVNCRFDPCDMGTSSRDFLVAKANCLD